MSAVTIALRIVAEDATGGAFGSLAGRLFSLMGASNLLGNNLLGLTGKLQQMTGTALGAGAAFALFSRGLGVSLIMIICQGQGGFDHGYLPPRASE